VLVNLVDSKEMEMEKDLAAVKGLKIKGSFQAIIPSLAPEEYALLEESIVTNGCRDAILTWNGFIVDGHNRYAICQKHGLHCDIEEIDFDTEQDALVWIVNNQLGRRNVTDYQKGELVLKKKDILLKKGKKQQGKRTDILSIVDKKLEPHSTRKEMAKDAGISSGTMARIEIIAKEAPEEMKEHLRRGKVKIGTAYKKLKKGVASEPEERKVSSELNAVAYAEMVIADLEKIRKDDPTFDQALDNVLEWMLKNNLRWAKGIAGNIRGIMQGHLRTRIKPKPKTSTTTTKRESLDITSKENLRGIQESLWGE
jgi:ParB-like chromosome segregation protein Spo0J